MLSAPHSKSLSKLLALNRSSTPERSTCLYFCTIHRSLSQSSRVQNLYSKQSNTKKNFGFLALVRPQISRICNARRDITIALNNVKSTTTTKTQTKLIYISCFCVAFLCVPANWNAIHRSRTKYSFLLFFRCCCVFVGVVRCKGPDDNFALAWQRIRSCTSEFLFKLNKFHFFVSCDEHTLCAHTAHVCCVNCMPNRKRKWMKMLKQKWLSSH